MRPSVLATYSEKPEDLLSSNNTVEFELSQTPDAGLFTWTLTHPAKAFSEINPVFKSKESLFEYAGLAVSKAKKVSSEVSLSTEISRVAVAKIENEWRAWVKVHEEYLFDEKKLDNMLMGALYRIILERDNRNCILCRGTSQLTIHHVIQKKRNITNAAPPFGRSVPTNLVTLCRRCHSMFDPLILA